MNIWNPSSAKHCTARSIYEIEQSRQKIAVFDDEEPDHLALYLMDGEKLWPARTIFLGDIETAWDILRAWAMKAPLIDFRNNQNIALP